MNEPTDAQLEQFEQDYRADCVAAEREACAKVADDLADEIHLERTQNLARAVSPEFENLLREVADEIRERGAK